MAGPIETLPVVRFSARARRLRTPTLSSPRWASRVRAHSRLHYRIVSGEAAADGAGAERGSVLRWRNLQPIPAWFGSSMSRTACTPRRWSRRASHAGGKPIPRGASSTICGNAVRQPCPSQRGTRSGRISCLALTCSSPSAMPWVAERNPLTAPISATFTTSCTFRMSIWFCTDKRIASLIKQV